VLDALLAAVLEQRVTGLEAHRAWRELLRRYGTALPEPVPRWLRVPPDAATLLAVPTWAWHRYAVDHRRQAAVRAVATVADRLQTLAAEGPVRLGAALRTVPGVGPWTVAETTLRVCADADAVSVGDYHVAHNVGYALTGRARTTDDQMLELLAPFAGRRALVIRLIELAGITAPRFGPRVAVRPHA
jgi:3-methyladenine DNA glycosylase/8-oxoguanine DNA glycosylase